VFDYAILKADNLPTPTVFELGDSTAVRRGERVVCLGYPLDFNELIATDGIVSAVIRRQSHRHALHSITTIVTNATIQWGNSGGPMLSIDSGKVIGINTFSHDYIDDLAVRMHRLAAQAQQSNQQWLADVVEYSLRYTHIGFNHAVSVDHVHVDPSWPA
jgi:hypothetical protein